MISKFVLYAAEPSSQPSNLGFDTFTNSSMRLSWTHAIPAPDGYIMLFTDGSAPTGTPVDGIVYAAGDLIGNAKVAFSRPYSDGTLFTHTGLLPLHTYYYACYSYNGNGDGRRYRLASPMTNNRQLIEQPPTAQPVMTSGYSPPPVFGSDFSISVAVSSFGAANDGAVIVSKVGSLPTYVPIDGTNYSDGQDVGDGNFIFFFSGINLGKNLISGQPYNTDIFYKIYAYRGATYWEVRNFDTVGIGLTGFPNVTDFSFGTRKSATVPANPTGGGSGSKVGINLEVTGLTVDANTDIIIAVKKNGSTPVAPTTGMPYQVGSTYDSGNTKVGLLQLVGWSDPLQIPINDMGSGTIYVDIYAATLNNGAMRFSSGPKSFNKPWP